MPRRLPAQGPGQTREPSDRVNAYLAAVRADGDLLVLETLFFADEVREPHQQISNLPGRVRLSAQEQRMARQLIESMTGPLRPSDYRDTYTDRGNDLIAAKKNDEEFQPAGDAPPGATVVDLTEAGRRGSNGPGGWPGPACTSTRCTRDGPTQAPVLREDGSCQRS